MKRFRSPRSGGAVSVAMRPRALRAARVLAPAFLAGLFFLLAPAAARAEITRLGDDVVPTFQAITLDVDADRPDYSGSVRVELEVARSVSAFRIHGREMTLTSLEMRDASGPVEVTAARTGRAEVEGVFTLTTSRPLVAGPAEIRIAFTNTFDTRSVGLYRVETGGRGYTFTQLEADDARRAFPCWDEPGFKIPYQLTLTVPKAHTAVSNTPVIEESEDAAGRRRYVFARTRPLPSYLLAIATGPLEYVDVPGCSTPTRVVTVLGQSHLAKAAVRTAPRILKALEDWFNEPYPYEKLDLIAVPEFWPGAMENPGAITFADQRILHESADPDPTAQLRMASIMAHELAHMWFGDVVTMKWWDDLWLNESFADWMGDKIAEQVYPELQGQLRELNSLQGTMAADARPTSRAVRKPVEDMNHLLSDVGVAYNKGKRVLSHFENWMGPETFRQGILDYIETHRWGSAEADDLWQALGRASGKDVKGVMSGFIDQPGYPLVSVALLPEGKVRISQRRFAEYGQELPPLDWRVPVGLRYSDGSGVRTQTVLLAEAERVVALDGVKEVDWVMPNANAGGYYRWSVPVDVMDRLTANAAQVLTPLERIGLIGNLSGLLAAGSIDGKTFLESLSRFSGDPEPLVISAIIENLGNVHESLVSEEARAPFASYVRRTLGPALDRIGLAPRSGEPGAAGMLRPQLLLWLGREGGDPAVLDYARTQTRLYETDPEKTDRGVARVCLELTALDGDAQLMARYRTRFEEAETPEERGNWLNGLTGFRDPAIRRAVLDYSLTDACRSNELVAIQRNLVRDETGREALFEWIVGNYDDLKGRVSSATLSFLPFVLGGCSTDRLSRGEAFFADPAHQVDGTDRQLARVAAAVHACAALREREGAGVAAWLKSTP